MTTAIESASPAKRAAETDNPVDAKKAKADNTAAEETNGNGQAEPEEDIDEDEVNDAELAAIDEKNIISGKRTRGKVDYRKASEELGDEQEEDDDADVTAPDVSMEAKTEDESDSDEEEEGDDKADE